MIHCHLDLSIIYSIFYSILCFIYILYAILYSYILSSIFYSYLLRYDIRPYTILFTFYSCLSNLSRNPFCPLDRKELSESQLRPINRVLKNVLGKLITLCDHSSDGCEWKDRWSELTLHLEKQCQFVEVCISCIYIF